MEGGEIVREKRRLLLEPVFVHFAFFALPTPPRLRLHRKQHEMFRFPFKISTVVEKDSTIPQVLLPCVTRYKSRHSYGLHPH